MENIPIATSIEGFKPVKGYNQECLSIGIAGKDRMLTEMITVNCSNLGYSISFKVLTLDDLFAAQSLRSPSICLVDLAILVDAEMEAVEKTLDLFYILSQNSKILLLSNGRNGACEQYFHRLTEFSLLDISNNGMDDFNLFLISVARGSLIRVPPNGTTVRRFKKVFPGFTSEETRILKLLGAGFTNRECAVMLKIPEMQIQAWRRKLMKKLGIHSTPKLMAYAIGEGLIDICDLKKSVARKRFMTNAEALFPGDIGA